MSMISKLPCGGGSLNIPNAITESVIAGENIEKHSFVEIADNYTNKTTTKALSKVQNGRHIQLSDTKMLLIGNNYGVVVNYDDETETFNYGTETSLGLTFEASTPQDIALCKVNENTVILAYKKPIGSNYGVYVATLNVDGTTISVSNQNTAVANTEGTYYGLGAVDIVHIQDDRYIVAATIRNNDSSTHWGIIEVAPIQFTNGAFTVGTSYKTSSDYSSGCVNTTCQKRLLIKLREGLVYLNTAVTQNTATNYSTGLNITLNSSNKIVTTESEMDLAIPSNSYAGNGYPYDWFLTSKNRMWVSCMYDDTINIKCVDMDTNEQTPFFTVQSSATNVFGYHLVQVRPELAYSVSSTGTSGKKLSISKLKYHKTNGAVVNLSTITVNMSLSNANGLFIPFVYNDKLFFIMKSGYIKIFESVVKEPADEVSGVLNSKATTGELCEVSTFAF